MLEFGHPGPWQVDAGGVVVSVQSVGVDDEALQLPVGLAQAIPGAGANEDDASG